MKKRLLKFALPIVLGVALMGVTLFGLVGCEELVGCDAGDLEGTNGDCMSCPYPYFASYNTGWNCGAPSNGVYCCY